MTTRSPGHPGDDAAELRPDFLQLPQRTDKPRRHGVTHVLDNGLSVTEAEHRVAAAGPSIDLWKLGWGTAYVDRSLVAKLALLAEHGILACTGGTLLEIAWQQGSVNPFMDWAGEAGFACIEVSCGSVPISREVKSLMIETVSRKFTVLAEVGSKDPAAPVSPESWAADAVADREAGATWVVTEGRESGTVGLYDPDGGVRAAVADGVVDAVGLEAVLFEAPRRDQQAWLVNRYGANVNLGNINVSEILAVECLRLGLRTDTIRADEP